MLRRVKFEIMRDGKINVSIEPKRLAASKARITVELRDRLYCILYVSPYLKTLTFFEVYVVFRDSELINAAVFVSCGN